MTGLALHPGGGDYAALLPWYVNGTLAADLRRDLETHLASCACCRAEVDRLREIELWAASATRSPHVPTETLVAYVEGRGSNGKQLETHLIDCEECRADVELLRRARRGRETGVPLGARSPRPGARNPWKPAFWAAAAVLVALVVAAPALVPRFVREEGLTSVTPVILLPPSRDATPPLLTGNGPWLLVVVLPDQTPPGRYAFRIESAGAAGLDYPEVSGSSDEEGRLTVLVPRPLAPGEYRLSLRPVEPGDAPVPPYRFAVEETRGGKAGNP